MTVDKRPGRLIGYARVSTLEQNLDMQIEALNRAGCKPIHIEKVSAARPRRPVFEWALESLRPGDTFVVWRLDRLGRDVRQIHRTLDDDSQVTIRHLMTQQILELRQLVMQPLPSRKLQLVPARTKRFGRAALPRRVQRKGRSVRLTGKIERFIAGAEADMAQVDRAGALQKGAVHFVVVGNQSRTGRSRARGHIA